MSVLMGVSAEVWVFTFTPSPRAFPFHFISLWLRLQSFYFCRFLIAVLLSLVNFDLLHFCRLFWLSDRLLLASDWVFT